LVTAQEKPFASYTVTPDGDFFIQMVSKREVIKLESH